MAPDDDARREVVRNMHAMRFGQPAPARRRVDSLRGIARLRGIEGARIRRLHEVMVGRYAVRRRGRRTGTPQSFVHDIADIFKFETVGPVAFRIAARATAAGHRLYRHGALPRCAD